MILQKKPKQVFRCNDDTFSTHNRRGACNWHGGLKTGKPIRLGAGQKRKRSDVQLVALEWIHVAHEWFQNRKNAFSARSVGNIIVAVQSGSFKWANMDAITLWQNPDDRKLYVLSGHSRFEAFRQLCAARMTAGGRGFCEIPAKVVDVDLATAKKIALESNTLATKETDLERAIFYRRQRLDGVPAKDIEALARRLEGKNWSTVLPYSYLNGAGKTWAALVALAAGQDDSRSTIKNIGRWIGNARRRVSALTNLHEDELYDWLVTRRGYGSGAGQVNSDAKFSTRLASIINRRTTFGVLEDRLNIQSSISLSPVERQYNAQLEELKIGIKKAERDLRAKISDLVSNDATEQQVADITAPLERDLRRKRAQLVSLTANYGKVRAAARNEQTLFGVAGVPQQYTAVCHTSGITALAIIAGITYFVTK